MFLTIRGFCALSGVAFREKYKTNSFVFISEAPPIFTAIVVKEVQAERSTRQFICFYFRGAAYLHGGSCKVVQAAANTREMVLGHAPLIVRV